MKYQTQAANTIDEYGIKSAYNLAAINLLSDKTFLSFILKRTVKELSQFSEEEIAERICDLRPHEVAVDPGKTNNPTFRQDPNNYFVGESHFIFDLLFLDAPNYAANTISNYRIEKRDLFGSCDIPEYAYDLMEVVMIRVSKDFGKADRSNDLITMVAALLSNHLDLEKRKEVLQSVGIAMTEESERRIQGMCNIADSVWDEALAVGKIEGKAEGKAEGMDEMLAATKAVLDSLSAGAVNYTKLYTQLVTKEGYSEALIRRIISTLGIPISPC